eukprot:8040463-Pyramimonas_sp.AAC.1
MARLDACELPQALLPAALGHDGAWLIQSLRPQGNALRLVLRAAKDDLVLRPLRERLVAHEVVAEIPRHLLLGTQGGEAARRAGCSSRAGREGICGIECESGPLT